MSDPDMMLPAGKMCADCTWFLKCRRMFRCKGESTTCDFAPSRFDDLLAQVARNEKKQAAQRPAQGGKE